MCGFFGVLRRGQPPADGLIQQAGRVQAHRGPDGTGVESFDLGDRSLVLGHQRLAIIDLSAGGHQPMAYGDAGSLVYNGELYNYIELRDSLRAGGATFKSASDTEVVLTALHQWGPEKALASFNWMGALAWFDRAGQRVVLARDAGSEKPLHYWCDGEQVVFASELKTLLTLADRRFSLDRDTIGQFLYQGLTDATSSTFFRGIYQLEPGSFASIPVADKRYSVTPTPYSPLSYEGDPSKLPFDRYVNELRELLRDSVRIRLRSDVPVGVLLSGGIDSSTIAALATQLSGGEVPVLLSAVSGDPRFDESEFMEIMERHLGRKAERIQLRFDPSTVMEDLALANWHNDAPIAGLQSIGHYQMMERAKELGVTVVLSGQGADEILLGYRKYLGFYVQALLRQRRPLRAGTELTRFVLNRSIVNQFDLRSSKRYLPLVRRLDLRQKDESTEGQWLQGWESVPVGLGSGTLAERQNRDVRSLSVPSLCRYEDRMSMALGREIRLPFLDTRLVDYLLRAPDQFKIGEGWTKLALRKAVDELLPPQIAWRKDKAGFSNPTGEWLKRELRQPVLEALANDGPLVQRGIVDGPAMTRRYARYCDQPVNGGLIWSREIVAALSLHVWIEQFGRWID